MGTDRELEEEAASDSAGTLGAVLYAASQPIGDEAEWAALVRAIAAGDQLALHALYERTHRPVFTLIMRLSRNRETAEEVTLDVFHDVWRKASGYDPANGTVLGWIMNQARSRGIDRLRFEQRKKRVDPRAGDSSGDGLEVRDALELIQETRAVHGALVVLTPDEREAVEAAFFAEMSHAEVAERLNEPLGTVKTRIRSALQKMRRALDEGTSGA